MNSIRQRVLFFLLIAGFVPLAIIVFTTNTVIQKEILKSEEGKVADVSRQLSKHLAEIMDGVARDLKTLETQPFLADENADRELQMAEMNRLVDVYEIYSDISLYNTQGALLCSTTEQHPIFKEYTSWFKESLNGETVISRPERKPGGGDRLYLMVYVPVITKGGAVCQVVKARLSFDRVLRVINGVRIGEKGSVVLIDQFGRIIGARDPERLLEEFDGEIPIDPEDERHLGKYVDASGTEFLYAAELLSTHDTKVRSSWTLLALKPMSEVNAVINKARFALVIAAAATLLVAVLLGYILSSLISKPLENARDVARDVAAGNLDVHMNTSGPKETVEMAQSLNQMGVQIRENRDKLESLVERRTKKLRDSEERLKKISAMLLASYEATQEAVLVVDPDGCVVAANRHFGEFFGLRSDTLPGKLISDMEQAIVKCFETPEAFRAEWCHLASDPYAKLESAWTLVEPEGRSLSIYSAPVSDREGDLCARLWMFRDTSEQHRLQAGMQEASKMEAVGRLAGGVAHDFNNLLTGIIGNLSLAEMGGGDDEGESTEELVGTAKRAGERAADLVKGLLGFSRRTHLTFRIADCNRVLDDVNSLTRRTFDPRIKIISEPEPNLWGAKVDPNQIEQVVMNMVVNAKDAMTTGTITMSTCNVTLEQKHLSVNAGLGSGDYIAIAVADDGEGMPPEVLEKIYEPFFTTKEQGKGTGLGLATSYGIIRQHGGWIDCTSKVGEGTVFTIYLPKAAESAVVEEAVRPEAKIVDRRGNETILLVDDENVVRNVAQSVLKHHGYKTLSAEDGIVALEFFEKGEQDIDLVLLDLTMPRLSGADTFKRIRAEFGDVPVIVCSGYTVNLDEFEAENGSRPNGFVQKPYNIADLAHQVREVLNEACLTA